MDEFIAHVFAAAAEAWLLQGLPSRTGALAHLQMRAAARYFRWMDTGCDPAWCTSNNVRILHHA